MNLTVGGIGTFSLAARGLGTRVGRTKVENLDIVDNSKYITSEGSGHPQYLTLWDVTGLGSGYFQVRYQQYNDLNVLIFDVTEAYDIDYSGGINLVDTIIHEGSPNGDPHVTSSGGLIRYDWNTYSGYRTNFQLAGSVSKVEFLGYSDAGNFSSEIINKTPISKTHLLIKPRYNFKTSLRVRVA